VLLRFKVRSSQAQNGLEALVLLQGCQTSRTFGRRRSFDSCDVIHKVVILVAVQSSKVQFGFFFLLFFASVIWSFYILSFRILLTIISSIFNIGIGTSHWWQVIGQTVKHQTRVVDAELLADGFSNIEGRDRALLWYLHLHHYLGIVLKARSQWACSKVDLHLQRNASQCRCQLDWLF